MLFGPFVIIVRFPPSAEEWKAAAGLVSHVRPVERIAPEPLSRFLSIGSAVARFVFSRTSLTLVPPLGAQPHLFIVPLYTIKRFL